MRTKLKNLSEPYRTVYGKGMNKNAVRAGGVDKMKSMTRIGFTAGLAAALVGCQSYSSAPPPVVQRQTGVEGRWVDPNGIISSFQAGRFETRTTDTNSLLAAGTYRQTSPTLVEIELTSILRNTTSRVNCAVVTRSQMNCTSSAGSQFTLARTS